MSSVAQNLNMVREKIKNACLKRAVELQYQEPRLVAVSKLHPKDVILEAYSCGQRHFGENYVQEILEKSFDEQVQKTCPDIQWHFIGHLQRNKVGKLLTVPNLFLVETVDSEKLAETLNTNLEKLSASGNERKLNIFIQVNTSGEEAKSGCTPSDAVNLVQYTIETCKYLDVKGLMTIGKYDNYNQEGANPDFETLIKCRDEVCQKLNIDKKNFELSMGMSGDYEHAIEVGATNVRVGSLIFGARPFHVKKY